MIIKRVSGAVLALVLFNFCGTAAAVPIISVDLDIGTPGTQSNRTLNVGDPLAIDILYTGDGETLFDTFTLDVVFNDTDSVLALTSENPTAGQIADTSPGLAFDVFGAAPVSSGSPLTPDSFRLPLGFGAGLGGVGISSIGGTPFSLVGDGETIALFRINLSAMGSGTSIVANTGFPFGANAELALAGAPVPVTLQSATVTVIPLPPALWLFATGLLGLFGGRCLTRPNSDS